ncbi:SusC/RagA family TonB-linked outer membrane protein [Bacteroides ovatus]|uniref:SusC/RagA family TonB-linked outer membrane protein n=1 Tax=Bacteroides ovatus TaxID=28116 RepID=UPI0020309BE2|nr:SusC/RagA family TonB-linked outer membrane protein [Bacteroides ovatus]MCM1722729.1 SusC/RagA family TonB-linked outer membrane protein [Bacteroides ovatus]MCM1756539.1 SusC/RagA family TonB-linked outer membrane protein [Bacteroides ovatus]MCM1868131.1 SusC/RagA family TonB-linked outer membrane protein [Bacteroides ovatus]MCM1911117.1 SusC/RagA family TonB-linked outer membrane protein [Bacteroides ovatus]
MRKTKSRERVRILSLVMALLLLPTMMYAIPESGKNITLNLESVTVKEFFDALRQQTGLSFVYNTEQTKSVKPITIHVKNETVDNVLRTVLNGTGLTYSMERDIVTISKVEQQANKRIATGIVSDEEGYPLPGVNVVISDLQRFAITDNNGKFSIEVPLNTPCTITFSYIGMSTQQVMIPSGRNDVRRNITLKSDTKLDEVVVTGIYTRKAESFTGSATTISSKDLMRVGNQNVFQSLKNLDPTLYIADNFDMGSDPNTTPSMSMRGTSSFPTTETNTLKSNYQNQPNQPLFILDGFETTAENILDMDMNRIESITILKDASAKALYGSKAANGVIVIETKRLTGNQQRVTYNGSISLEMPDLTSYDLCNAWEKLEAERLDGVYTHDDNVNQEELTRLYNERKKNVMEGLDTYWLSKPLRTGIGHKHNLNIELGDSQNLRAIIDVTYNQVTGVMKGSDRRNISGDFNISYRRKNLIFKNILSILVNKSNDSPYGSYSEYSRMNPYWAATDKNGNLLRWVEFPDNIQTRVANPMYNATIGTSFTSNYLRFTNNFYAEWYITPAWKATVRLGISQQRDKADDFYPANHSMFKDYTSEETLIKRGKYILENGESNSISSDLNINYNKLIGKHTIFANAGFFISEDKSSAYQHTAEGFGNNQIADITFARQYAEGVTPIGYSSINRQASFLLAASYDYDNRYLADATIRESASSLYGSDNRWANSWSFGVGWNLHNEAFIKNLAWLKQFKLRASVGLTGNQNFDTNAALATYKYYTGISYGGFTGAYLSNMPNPKLKWEQKKDYNIGFDMRIAKLSLTFDYYSADTKNMLTNVSIPTSTGFAIVKDNLGLVRNSGVEAKANYTVWQNKKGFFNVYGTFTYTKNKIIRLSESMRAYNEKMMKMAEKADQSAPVLMYQDGLSMNTIWAVPSAGIDPQSGNEIYIKKDGAYTYKYSANDMVAAGDATPKYRGTAGFTAEYNGFGLSATVSYLAGCQMYNSTLVDRVENADITYNVDRRLLQGRWTTPGQQTQYKKFNSSTRTRATTRFVQDRKELNLSSISAYYEFPSSIYQKLYMERLRLSFYINDIATFSSIKVERGLNYPFARTMSFSLNATF